MPRKLLSPPPRENLMFHRSLSIESLLKIVQGEMAALPEYRIGPVGYSMTETAMSGLAVFLLKYPSLLQFDINKDKRRIRHNLRTLFGVVRAPSDSTLREVCDEIDPRALRPAFSKIIQQAQSEGVLDEYAFLGGVLLSVDGTGQFSSGSISCPQCCEKQHRNGKVEHYHQLMCAAIVHPNKAQVFPLFPEAITRQDGKTKNDCESNASKRLLPAIREALPEFKFIILQDAIGADAPNIRMIKKLGYSYIITVKPDDQESLYREAEKRICKGEYTEIEETDKEGKEGIIRGYRFINGVPLNKSNPDVLVNYLDYWEVKNGEQIYNHQWITSITLTKENVNAVMRAGRARWKVENETFNTLKNLGYNLEHNYGHGKKYLSTVFATLMMLAFLLDQMQEHVCALFRAARNKFYSRKALWEEMRALFRCFFLKTWMAFWLAIIFDEGGDEPQPDTG